MFRKTSRALTFCGVLASAGAALGQLPLGDACCPQPQPCFQTVPVTELRECRQVVQRPVVETTYVDQPCTEYRQVVENQTAVVPTVCYQNVTECQTIQRDCGRWVTNYQCRPQMSPCQYDNRDDLFGYLNRAGYSLRMAFTPQVYAERTYVPNVVAQTIPVVRQVAVRGSRTVNYQVSRMVPYTTTRRVAVNTVRMVAQEVVTRHPVTVFRTVPYGSSLAFGPTGGIGYGSAYANPYAAPRAAALQPTPDPAMGPSRTATLQPKEDPFSTATLPKADAIKVTPKASGALPDALKDDSDDLLDRPASTPAKKSSYIRPSSVAPAHYDDATTADEQKLDRHEPVEPQVASAQSAARVGRWVARRTPRPSGPVFPDAISVAGTDKTRR